MYISCHLVPASESPNIYGHFRSFRLRHEKMKPVPIDRGGPSEYQMLSCYNLESIPRVEPPKHVHKSKDPFNFMDDIDTSA